MVFFVQPQFKFIYQLNCFEDPYAAIGHRSIIFSNLTQALFSSFVSIFLFFNNFQSNGLNFYLDLNSSNWPKYSFSVSILVQLISILFQQSSIQVQTIAVWPTFPVPVFYQLLIRSLDNRLLIRFSNSVISGDQEVVSGRHLAVQLERWLSKGLATPSLFASSSPLISLVFCGGPCSGLSTEVWTQWSLLKSGLERQYRSVISWYLSSLGGDLVRFWCFVEQWPGL